MTTIITTDGRRDIPNDENVIVKVSGWVKYKKNGEVRHIPPNQIKEIQERDPDMKQGVGDSEHIDSSVIYQSPHGRV